MMHFPHVSLAAKFVLVTAAFSLLCAGPTGCTRTVRVSKQMTWECAPEEFNRSFSAKPDEYVRFRFVENPRCFEVETSKNLCAELKEAGRPIVTVDFAIWGRRQTVKGYETLAIDGRPLQNEVVGDTLGQMAMKGLHLSMEAFRSH